MNVLRGLMIGIVALVLLLVALGFALPRRAHVERSVMIDRPVSTVFAVLNGFRHFADWSPWAKLDPALKTTLSGPVDGVGARVEWSSEHGAVGSGSQEITESVANRRVAMRVSFSGTDSSNAATFDLQSEGAGTRVTWSHDADFGANVVDRYFGLLLERMVGPGYEQGLAQLEQHVESLPEADFSDFPVERIEVVAQPIAFVSGRTTTEPGAIARAYEKAYAQVSAALGRENIKPTGPPLAIGRKWDADRGIYEFDAAIPVPEGTTGVRTDRDVQIGRTYAGLVLRSVHRGPHDGLGVHLQKLMAYKQAVGFESNGAPWDVYVSNASTSGAHPVTETYVPVK